MSAETLKQIEGLLSQLTREEKVALAGCLAVQLQQEPTQQPVVVRGRWKDKFPPDFDIDKALKEIRSEWEGEMEDIIHGRPPR